MKSIEGTFIAEAGEFQSEGNSVSREQLKVSGALMGNLEPLLNKRWYIGDPVNGPLEPNVAIDFDLRLLEDTPPALQQFLGTDWQEGIE